MCKIFGAFGKLFSTAEVIEHIAPIFLSEHNDNTTENLAHIAHIVLNKHIEHITQCAQCTYTSNTLCNGVQNLWCIWQAN